MIFVFSVLAVLAASACAFLVIVQIVISREFNLKDEATATAFLIFISLFLFCTGITSWWGASLHGWAVQLAGMVTFTAVACGFMWTHTNLTWGHDARMKEILGTPHKFARGIWQRIMRNDASVRRYAKKRVSVLCAFIPGLIWSDIRMALISDDGHAELDKRLLLFAGALQSVKVEERVAEQELRSFLGHPVKSLSEDTDVASQMYSHVQRKLE